MIRPEDVASLQPWVNLWNVWISTVFVRSYQEHTAGASFLPQSSDEFEMLLAHYLLERALRELGYELEDRPAWAVISIRGILQLL
jgi:maltose alpha-D-glucosyltransferase/alpha-amylase